MTGLVEYRRAHDDRQHKKGGRQDNDSETRRIQREWEARYRISDTEGQKGFLHD